MADTVKDVRKALKRVTSVLDTADEYTRVYVRTDTDAEFLLTGKVTVDANGFVVLHAE